MRIIAPLLQVFFSETCLHCGIVIPVSGLFCEKCSAAGFIWAKAEQSAIYQQAHAFEYTGIAKSLLKAAKFSDRRRALKLWIELTKPGLQALCEGNTIVLALPSRRKFLHRLLKKIIPKEKLVLSAFEFGRVKTKSADANKLLGEAARYRRIHDSLMWSEQRIKPADRYIICDDVSTTGATLTHAAYLAEKNLGIQKEQITVWALLYRPREFTS